MAPRQRQETPATDSPERGRARWLTAVYEPVSLFSLRMTHATNKGGKTLVVPTPYSVKMAVLDACFRRWGADEADQRAREVFDLIKRREVRIRPPDDAVVQQTFVKILDRARDPSQGPYRQTISYREFVFFRGELQVALAVDGLSEAHEETLRALLACINTFGKRGSFFQFLLFKENEPDQHFTQRRDRLPAAALPYYLMSQALDDFGPDLCSDRNGFDRVSTYGDGSITLQKHRVLDLTAIPYRRVSASRRFTWYRHTALPDL